jgi:hypothetical protein
VCPGAGIRDGAAVSSGHKEVLVTCPEQEPAGIHDFQGMVRTNPAGAILTTLSSPLRVSLISEYSE